MSLLFGLAAPLALLAISGDAGTALPQEAATMPDWSSSAGTVNMAASQDPLWMGFAPARPDDRYNQVRIKQRMTIRIEPRPGSVRTDLAAVLENEAGDQRYSRQAMGRCVAAGDILGVRAAEGSQLLLFLKEQGLVLASLEAACSSRDFYSGFYFERNGDGQLCIERERLQSRSGAKCQLVQLERLVARRSTR